MTPLRKAIDAGRTTADIFLRPSLPRTLPVLAIFITERCDGQCVSCPIHTRRSTCELSLEQIRGLRQEATELGTRVVGLSGGEPLLHPELCGIVEELERRGDMRVNLSTNGHSLDSRLARSLQEVGLTSITVSVESPDESVHDALRGRGAHASAVDAVLALRAHAPQVKVALGLTLSKPTLDTLPGMPALAKRLGAHALRVQLVRDGFEQAGLAPSVFAHLRVGPETNGALWAQLDRTQRAARALGIRTDSVRYLQEMDQAVHRQRRTPCVAGCLAASVHARGVIKPCPDSEVEQPLSQGLAAAWRSEAFVAHRTHTCPRQAHCTDATYHKLSVHLDDLRSGRLGPLAGDLRHLSLHRQTEPPR